MDNWLKLNCGDHFVCTGVGDIMILSQAQDQQHNNLSNPTSRHPFYTLPFSLYMTSSPSMYSKAPLLTSALTSLFPYSRADKMITLTTIKIEPVIHAA